MERLCFIHSVNVKLSKTEHFRILICLSFCARACLLSLQMVASKIAAFLILFLSREFLSVNAQKWVRAGFWYTGSELPIREVNSALFTHLLCGFADVDNSTYEISIPSSDEHFFSTFTDTLKRKNPSIKTLLSVWSGQSSTGVSILGDIPNSTVLTSMVSEASYRKSFIQSAIKAARRYGFDGIDLFWVWPNAGDDLGNMGILLDEWRAAVNSEQRKDNESQLILTMALHYLPMIRSMNYPIESIRKNLDWGHVLAYDYYVSKRVNFTRVHAALYDPSSKINTDFGIKEWTGKGLPANKMVLGLAYHGYAWTLVNPKDNGIGAPASGPAVTLGGDMAYKFIKYFIRNYGYGAVSVYNASYVVNYCVLGSNWIGYDDVEAIRAKVSYAKEVGLLGYNAFQVANDEMWVLSQAAYGDDKDEGKIRKLLVIILVPIAAVLLLVGCLMCYFRCKALKSRDTIQMGEKSLSEEETESFAAVNFNSSVPNLQVFSFESIKAATNNFSYENIVGEGGFGPVYKGKLPLGPEIAVKRLSKTSSQGLEEFKNEVTLGAKLQHVNLLRVLGFCSEGEEKMLIYENMPNRSLDLYLFDPIRRSVLDWNKCIHIIEGITQGLLYLQEYSNYTIVHRDLKSSNILLDDEMNPKISDFGMARVFSKDELEANTSRIVGTYGYVPPEYVRKGIYSKKYDVYSFGVLLLQIISGKRSTCYYGLYENLHLLEYAYELWNEGRGMVEFIDDSLDDSSSSCKLMRCMQIALLCVQENPVDRPSMLEVSAMLKSETAAIGTPKKPAFSVKRDVDDEADTSALRDETLSANNVSFSQMVPR